MASLETFESTLHDVVNAKRLSASKMSTLTDIALKCMKNDTQLVSTLFRTHKMLPPSAKVNSLYVFDALSRAARNQVNKHRLTAPSDPSQGNCATFIVKVEGVLDSLFQDMVSIRDDTLKEKSKKILDIWVKNGTFPSAVLGRLSQFLQDSGKELEPTVAARPTDPRGPPVPVPATKTPPQVPDAVTANTVAVKDLITLLAKASNTATPANPSQIVPNTATPVAPAAPPLTADPLALIQQLAHAAGLANGVPAQPVSLPVSLVPSSSSATSAVPVLPPSDRGPLQPPPYGNDHYGSGRRESNHDTYAGPDRGRNRDDYYDERRDFRGDRRGDHRGGFRGSRGRGRGRWDDRDRYNERSRDQEWGPPNRGRRSRSRSPPGRYGGRRDMASQSPPRRPPAPGSRYSDRPMHEGSPRTPETGKDEFGRDIRLGSPDNTIPGSTRHSSADTQSPPVHQPQAHSATTDPRSAAGRSHSPRRDGPSYRSPPPTRRLPGPSSGEIGLGAFDLTMFDPTSPASWTALGNAWKVTHGYLPSQEELMAYVLGGAGILPTPNGFTVGGDGQWPGQADVYGGGNPEAEGGNWLGNGGMEGGGHSGGTAYGNGRDADHARRETHGPPMTGYNKTVSEAGSERRGSAEDEGSIVDLKRGDSGESGAGRMEKIGDRWVFVRTAAQA